MALAPGRGVYQDQWRDALSLIDIGSDEGLEASLRRELIEVACFNGVSDPETLRDILLDSFAKVRPAP